jgi:hypothetical protein
LEENITEMTARILSTITPMMPKKAAALCTAAMSFITSAAASLTKRSARPTPCSVQTGWIFLASWAGKSSKVLSNESNGWCGLYATSTEFNATSGNDAKDNFVAELQVNGDTNNDSKYVINLVTYSHRRRRKPHSGGKCHCYG